MGQHGKLALVACIPVLVVIPSSVALAEEGGDSVLIEVAVSPDTSERFEYALTAAEPGAIYRGYCMPHGATITGVRDSRGNVSFTLSSDGDSPLVGFTTRETLTVISGTRPVADPSISPYYRRYVSACTPAGASVQYTLTLPPGAHFVALSEGATVVGDGRASLAGDGPLSLEYAFLLPISGEQQKSVVDEGAFRLTVAPVFADRAREVARIVSPLLHEAATEAGLSFPWEKIHVDFAPASGFSWENGLYLGGSMIRIREDVLHGGPEEGYPYVAARTLLHESFHAISVPNGTGSFNSSIAWFVEGAAGHAERMVDRVMPGGHVRCLSSGTTCYIHERSLLYAELLEAYSGGFEFDGEWSPDEPQTEENRRFYYGYTAFLISAYVKRFGAEAYRAAWDDFEALSANATCLCTSRLLADRVAFHGGNVSDADLFYPYLSSLGSGIFGPETTKLKENVRDLVDFSEPGTATYVNPDTPGWLDGPMPILIGIAGFVGAVGAVWIWFSLGSWRDRRRLRRLYDERSPVNRPTPRTKQHVQVRMNPPGVPLCGKAEDGVHLFEDRTRTVGDALEVWEVCASCFYPRKKA